MTVTSTSSFTRVAGLLCVGMLISTGVLAQGLKRVDLNLVDVNGKTVGDITGQYGTSLVHFSYSGKVLRLATTWLSPNTSPVVDAPGYVWLRREVYFTGPDCTGLPVHAYTDGEELTRPPGTTPAMVAGGPSAAVYFWPPADTSPFLVVASSQLYGSVAYDCRNGQFQLGSAVVLTKGIDLGPVYTEPFHIEGSAGRGDANGNGKIEPSDIMYLINYLFGNGPEP